MRTWIAAIWLIIFCQFSQAQAEAVKPPRPPEKEEVVLAAPRAEEEPAANVPIVLEIGPTPKTNEPKINYALKAREGDLNRLKFRLSNAQKKRDALQKDYDRNMALRPDWEETKEGADVSQKLNKASDDAQALQWQVWDVDDEVQTGKGQPLHGRMLLVKSGKNSTTLPTITVGGYPVTLWWEAGANAPHRIRVVNAAGETLFRSTANRGEQKLKAAGDYNVEIASAGSWLVTVWRGEAEN